MKLIDAESLEADGWKMERIIPVDRQTMEWQKKKPTDFPVVDAVPVVRCKDCKDSHLWYADKSICELWAETGVDVFNDGFCSYGERKDDGN